MERRRGPGGTADPRIGNSCRPAQNSPALTPLERSGYRLPPPTSGPRRA